MIAVAVLLLPALGLLLYGMDRIEDWLPGRPRAARHARGRHLRLVHSTSRPQGADRSPRYRDVA
ncbi:MULTISPECIES: hypothetical protein [Streptomyces]|uniref:hypothetical protein n=1 Tax=Streptomyces TaxID=1883 RepID=UPI0024434D62|nr:hypothetical protein [Streptomyces sp. DH10]MDG9709570.1 hypothetical protein [Streptomyces sp. DH10]